MNALKLLDNPGKKMFTSFPSYRCSSSSVKSRTGLLDDLYMSLTSWAIVIEKTMIRTKLAVAMLRWMFARACGIYFLFP